MVLVDSKNGTKQNSAVVEAYGIVYRLKHLRITRQHDHIYFLLHFMMKGFSAAVHNCQFFPLTD